MKTFNVTPIGKPRMTRSDKWKKRDCVVRYFKFKDEIRQQMGDFVFPNAGARIWFIIPVPDSWSIKKKEKMLYEPHQQKPDIDNLVKALFDAMLDEDCKIHNYESSKLWGLDGKILIAT